MGGCMDESKFDACHFSPVWRPVCWCHDQCLWYSFVYVALWYSLGRSREEKLDPCPFYLRAPFLFLCPDIRSPHKATGKLNLGFDSRSVI